YPPRSSLLASPAAVLQPARFHFFIFSSRRRHTISKRDWSSDVCSSDLPRRRDRRRQDDRRAPPRRRGAGGGMKVGLTGFAGAGKTTVFTALTGLQARPAAPGAVNLGVIKVPDPRVDKLAEIYHPRKTTYAE